MTGGGREVVERGDQLRAQGGEIEVLDVPKKMSAGQYRLPWWCVCRAVVVCVQGRGGVCAGPWWCVCKVVVVCVQGRGGVYAGSWWCVCRAVVVCMQGARGGLCE